MNEKDRDDAQQLVALLEEIRDLMRAQNAEYEAQSARSIAISEEAVARQAAMIRYYKKVVLVAAVLVAVIFVVLGKVYLGA